jgi:hypothetical protein
MKKPPEGGKCGKERMLLGGLDSRSLNDLQAVFNLRLKKIIVPSAHRLWNVKSPSVATRIERKIAHSVLHRWQAVSRRQLTLNACARKSRWLLWNARSFASGCWQIVVHFFA